MTGRARWLKKTVETKDVKKEKKKVVAPQTHQQVVKEVFVPKVEKPSWRIEDKMTEEELDKRISELVSSRGRKGVDQKDMLRQLEVLTKAARLHGAAKEIPVLMHLISSMFDTQKSIDDFMDHHQWNTCYRALVRVLSLIEQNRHLRIVTLGSDDLADITLAVSKIDVSTEGENTVRVVGSVDSFVLRLEEEYTKSLQQINPHTQVRRTYIISHQISLFSQYLRNNFEWVTSSSQWLRSNISEYIFVMCELHSDLVLNSQNEVQYDFTFL